MCSESFWFQEASNRHSWKYTRFLGSYQGKGWHLWVACVSIIHSIPGNLKSQKQLVCSSKSLWGTNVAFIKSVLLLAHSPPHPHCLSSSIWLGKHCSHQSFHIKLRLHIRTGWGALGSQLCIKPHLQHPRLLLPLRKEGGIARLWCQWYSGPLAYSPRWESASLVAQI